MDYQGKDILIVGMARSGVAAAKMLTRLGARITVNDMRTREQLGGALDALDGLDITWRLGEEPDAHIDGRDMIVFSSGVPFWKEWILKARGMGIPCVNELEVGYHVVRAPMVAITGTNGKTTTTTLMCEVARTAGMDAYAVGNIGLPVCAHALDVEPEGLLVAEVAPFQMISTIDFRPKVSMILNITEDHLNWFKTMQNYIDGKCLVFKNQQENDFCILNYDDEITRGLANRPRATVLFISHEIEPGQGAYVKDGEVHVKLGGEDETICCTSDIALPGEHNLENALAVILAARVMGIGTEPIVQTLKTFRGVEHRIETVRTVGGVTYINDSKATNPVAAIKAVRSMDAGTVLLLGGSEKDSDFLPLFEAFTDKIVSVIALGETADRILAAARQAGYTEIEKADSFEAAVLRARELAQPGMYVLLSPACASYDMFDDFEQRGATFKQIVQEMTE